MTDEHNIVGITDDDIIDALIHGFMMSDTWRRQIDDGLASQQELDIVQSQHDRAREKYFLARAEILRRMGGDNDE